MSDDDEGEQSQGAQQEILREEEMRFVDEIIIGRLVVLPGQESLQQAGAQATLLAPLECVDHDDMLLSRKCDAAEPNE